MSKHTLNPWNRLIKRAFDLCGALALILLSSPFMLLAAALVKMNGQGPLIFKQERTGLNGQPFIVYKFRTMVPPKTTEDTLKHTLPDDPRLTRIGRFLRNASLDELPQLFNVVKGDMSLVGPRPQATYHTEMYREMIPNYDLRHMVKPGITGLVQISNLRNRIDTQDDMEKRVLCDLHYIEHWSLWLDIKICLKTFTTMIFRYNMNERFYRNRHSDTHVAD